MQSEVYRKKGLVYCCTFLLICQCCGLTLAFELMSDYFNSTSAYVCFLSVATDQFRRTNGALQEGGKREAIATSQLNGIAGMRGGQVRRRRGCRGGASGDRTGMGRVSGPYLKHMPQTRSKCVESMYTRQCVSVRLLALARRS